jgi:hypothetical protein
VRVDNLRVVHAVEVIAREDHVVVGFVARNVARRLTDGVSRALEPVGVVRRLFGRQDFDEALAEQIHPVGLPDMPVERRGVELRQDEDAPDIGVQAIADRDVDEAVLAGDRDRRLRTKLGEREEPRALTAAEHERQNFIVKRHRISRMLHRRGLCV